ncbi:MAG: hypothetical protein LBL86_01150 [Coriobacteriales bacterium]|jgi:hypothetical protein|nr:hypothetical protein [Coriobacteriales bacterium]
MRPVLAFLAAFGALLVLLAVQQGLERCERAPGAFDFLLASGLDGGAESGAGDSGGLDDPLGLLPAGFEIVGIAQEGAVVGYAAEGDVSQTLLCLDGVMRSQGWEALEMNAQGIASYVRKDMSADLPWVYVLFVCSECGEGTSVVAELL